MKTEQAAFAARLHKLLAEKKIEASPVELVQLLARYGKVSVTPQTISGWLNGSFMPRLGNLRALAGVLGVDPHALQTDGKARQVNEPSPLWSTGLSGKDRLAFQEFVTLPAAQRKLVRELIAALASGVTRG
jgi:transcriptional regulator with XRE-family HTH domain